MTHSRTTADRANDMIPGVVDGTVSASADAEGNVSLHILVGGYGRNSELCDRIEFVLSEEHARRLAETLAAGPAAATGPVPCSVGIRLNAPLADAEPGLAPAGPTVR